MAKKLVSVREIPGKNSAHLGTLPEGKWPEKFVSVSKIGFVQGTPWKK
jgi:hypothetical protein